MIIYNINYNGFKLILERYTKKLILTPKTMVQRNVTLWNQIQILYQLVSAGFVEPGLLTMDTRMPALVLHVVHKATPHACKYVIH